ncbi:DMT family transporter [Aerococcus kribbianus]|uniref:DMT family transporter n=1 Tax=Aerococcus kribbianus TaxID=2999064 RepID=A0A9X3JFD4_9LACT|nr:MULTISPECIES: DMT family transporter [unclassified Aerococcus]MCZ0716962.1 DMT family transporter [Aerococcus sp. YH-aer221]MCZ0725250.1 DMT family transporter [Aerococcus sp. YH-aer222]
MKLNKETLGKLGLLITAIIWGSGFTFSAIALDYFTTFRIIAMRFSIAFVILLVLNYKQLKQINKTYLFKGEFIGSILFLAYFLQTTGLEYTTSSKKSFLTAVNVVLVPFIVWIVTVELQPLKEK